MLTEETLQHADVQVQSVRGEDIKTDGPDPLDEQVEQDDRRLEAKAESLEDPLFVSSLFKSLAIWNERISGENLLSLPSSDAGIPLLQSVLMLEQIDLHSESEELRGTA